MTSWFQMSLSLHVATLLRSKWENSKDQP